MRRFWSKVLRGGPEQCWPWQTSASTTGGYGKFRLSTNRLMNAHKMAYILSKGEVPDGKVVRHKCDNPLCCNPDHLELGTQLDNVWDMQARGRGRWSEREVDNYVAETICSGCRKAIAVDRGLCRECAEHLETIGAEL